MSVSSTGVEHLTNDGRNMFKNDWGEEVRHEHARCFERTIITVRYGHTRCREQSSTRTREESATRVHTSVCQLINTFMSRTLNSKTELKLVTYLKWFVQDVDTVYTQRPPVTYIRRVHHQCNPNCDCSEFIRRQNVRKTAWTNGDQVLRLMLLFDIKYSICFARTYDSVLIYFVTQSSLLSLVNLARNEKFGGLTTVIRWSRPNSCFGDNHKLVTRLLGHVYTASSTA